MIWAIGTIGQAPRMWLSGAVSAEILDGACRPGEIHVQSTAERPGTIEWKEGDGEMHPVFVPAATSIGGDEMLWRLVRIKRNGLLDHWRWTVQADSPLSNDSRADWLEYLAALNRVTIDFADPRSVMWPEEPPLIYP